MSLLLFYPLSSVSPSCLIRAPIFPLHPLDNSCPPIPFSILPH